jgi:uncharacterized protein
LAHARGVLSAIACEPTLQDPTDWLPLILGSEVPDESTLTTIFELLLRDRHAIAECMALGQPYAPHPEDHSAVLQFCKGFVRVTQTSKAWQSDTEAVALVLPIAVLAGYLKLESLRKLQPDMPLDEAQWARDHRQRLPDSLADCYQHFAPARETQRTVEAAGKVGRNDPCPCGSGKKYKKCCGAGS